MKAIRPALALLVLFGGLSRASRAEPRTATFQWRWFYAMQNLLVDKNADELVNLIGRARQSGYDGVVLADYKLNILGRMPKEYIRNVERVKAAAHQAGIEIIPAVFPVGYSDGLLAHDPNLAEGLPVERAPFVVEGREARLLPEPEARIRNGGLEETKGESFAGFSFQDDPGKATVADRETVHGGKVSCRMPDTAKNSSSGNARLITKATVRPHACYRYSGWVKTRNLASPNAFRLLATGGKAGRPLTFFEGGVQRSQDWTRVDVVFNSLDESQVNLYAGLWGGSTGTVWIDDLALEELSLVNVLRRGGCPLLVTSADGTTRYEEGKDFEPVSDPKLGLVPYAGQFSFAHEGPKIRLTSHSRIKEGQRLGVGWYHPVLTHGSQITCCLTEPKVFDLLRDQARRVEELLHPNYFFMSHDEIRVANWCRTCRDRRQTPGHLLAENVRECVDIVRTISPKATVLVWSDMFDPYHNAVADYFLVNGTLARSWEGLPAEVVVANWNSGKARQSLSFFAGRGHRQLLAGYYDVDDLSSLRSWSEAAAGVAGVKGFMYTTWEHKFGLMEKYGEAMQEVARP